MRFVEWWHEISWPRRVFRRALFRWFFPWCQQWHDAFPPADGEEMYVLVASHQKNPLWVAYYDAKRRSFQSEDRWFTPDEVDFYASTVRGAYPNKYNKETK